MMMNTAERIYDDKSSQPHRDTSTTTTTIKPTAPDAEVLANYTQIYTNIVGCLVSESDSLNLTLGEGFWLPILYESLQLPYNVTTAAFSQPYTTTTVSYETYSFANGDDDQVRSTTSYWSGEQPGFPRDNDQLPLEVIREIWQRCFFRTPVMATHRPYLLVWWQQFLWTLVFGAMMAMAVGGNTLVMWIICAHRRMRTVTNYFLMNLSAADLFMSVLNCMFNFIYMLHSDWPFGAVYCTISNFMANVTISASVFTLMAISFDRYIAIVKPLEPRMSKTSARVFILVIWSSSMVLSLPCLLYSTTVSFTYKDDEVRRGCILRWPDGQTSSSQHEHIYNIVFFITTYLLPMLVMLVCYFLIGRELWGSRSIGELTDRQAASIRSKRRVVKMFIIIVTMFGLCWLPQQAFFLYTFHNSQILDTAHIQHIYLAFYWLAMANAMINPVIYYWMNARFRSYIKEVVLKCLCLKCPRRPSNYDGSPQLERRCPPCDDHSSRSRSDSRQGVNGTLRTTPGSLRSNNHVVVYSSRERLNARNGVLTAGGRRGPAQCDICLHTMRPALLNTMTQPPSLDTHLQTIPLTTVRGDILAEQFNYRASTCLQSQL
nr:putative tachykinin-related peptide receptor II variant 3 [Homarus americanus]